MAEVHTGIHAAALAARRLLDFDLVAHLSLEDLHNLFPNLQAPYDKEIPRAASFQPREPIAPLPGSFP
jgi:hypothetical protein